MQVPDSIRELVERFERNKERYLSDAYKEANVRVEFVDPLFRALGWDVSNERGYAEEYKDVVYEPSLQVEGAPRAPDYSFRIGGVRKFFVEAKKPRVNIARDAAPAYQLRRYAWSAKLPLSILTDFEELAVYDTRIRPKPGDRASVARVMYLRFDQLVTEWESLASVFSKQAILLGSFDRYAVAATSKRGTASVDRAFLKEIERWRELLAGTLAAGNPSLSTRELNAAVQSTIDRIVFLRIAEDRAIEEYGQLRDTTKKKGVYESLKRLYWRADQKYNSGLFHFAAEKGRDGSPDRFTLDLRIEDSVLRDIIGNTYYPDSPYEFSVLAAEILGNVYEQFLGKVISIEENRSVTIEEKPEVRKAGGVYYTPGYVVRYIVERTVGRLLHEATPDVVATLRIVDPACGSGSFLLGAYQYLLDWHSRWYVENRENYKRKYRDRIRESSDGSWRLTTAERKRILVTNLFGVDVDPQAVEVTKLSLLLKVLEGETQESLEAQLGLFAERALPELGGNIKCGNSLVAFDYYQDDFSAPVSEDEITRVNPFDWKKEFPSIMKNGGFHAVIGNPPYVFGRDWQSLGIGDDMKAYFAGHYSASPYQMDMFSLFMEKAFALANDGGYIGQIVPNVWLTNTYSTITRSFVLGHAHDLTVTAPPKNVFPGLTVDTSIYTYRKGRTPASAFVVERMMAADRVAVVATNDVAEYLDGQKPISISVSADVGQILTKIRGGHPRLAQVAAVTRGVHPYRTGGYGQSAFGPGAQTRQDVDARPYHSAAPQSGYRPFIYGRDLKRFEIPRASDFVRYGPWLAEPRDARFFEGERLYSRKILGERLIVTVETGDSVADQQVYITKPVAGDIDAYALAGILGSRMMAFYIRRYFDEFNDAFPQVKVGQLKDLPIAQPADPHTRNTYTAIRRAVADLMDLRSKVGSAKVEGLRTGIERQIQTRENALDRLVCELYGLSDADILAFDAEDLDCPTPVPSSMQ
jgi:hypothetical protein